MDLIPDLNMNDQTVITTIAGRRVVHNERQQNLAGIAQATPGAAAHVPVPWTDEMSRLVLQQMNLARRTTQRQTFHLNENLSALIFVSLADMTQDQRNTVTSI